MAFNGLGMSLGNLSRLSSAKTRSISAENFTGEKGKAGMSVDGPRLKPAPHLLSASAPGQSLIKDWRLTPRIPSGSGAPEPND